MWLMILSAGYLWVDAPGELVPVVAGQANHHHQQQGEDDEHTHQSSASSISNLWNRVRG